MRKFKWIFTLTSEDVETGKGFDGLFASSSEEQSEKKKLVQYFCLFNCHTHARRMKPAQFTEQNKINRHLLFIQVEQLLIYTK